MSQNLTRKEFLTASAKYAAGVTAGVAGVNLLSAGRAKAGARAFAWPWPYEKLDPEYVRVLGHDSFWAKACSYAAFNGIIQALSEKVGEPFSLIPTEMLIYGHGGAGGWGTLCGTLNGASAAICLVHEKAVSDVLVNELIGWYTQTEFPTATSNTYAVEHRFTDTRCDKALTPTLSGSPLCHIAVTEWCIATGYKVQDVERKERCARIAGDVAAHAVELLNAQYDQQFTPSYVASEAVTACMSCHGSGFVANVASKMECADCHADAHKTVDVVRSPEVPAAYALQQNYPNPFNPQTSIRFAVPEVEKVHVAIFDVRGRLIRTLVDHELYSPGTYTITWDGTDKHGQVVASGVYFTRMQAGRFASTQKMTMVR